MDEIVIIHHADLDGFCSGAIAYRELKDKYPFSKISTIEMNYDRELPVLPNNIKQLFILDFSFKDEIFERVINCVGRHHVVWLDHHKSVIENLTKYNDLSGKRAIDKCGALLTWEYFHPVTFDIIPPIVKYVDDYDRWVMNYGNDTLCLYEYITGLNIHDVQSKIWDFLLSRTDDEIKPLIKMGNELNERRHGELKELIKDVGIPIKIMWNGNEYSCLKINSTYLKSTSQLGCIVYDELGYDIFWCYYDKMTHDGKLNRTNKLRSVKVDVSKMVETRGGGGHKNAAGWYEIKDVIKDTIEIF
jgi:oligoribonuclease NrnB/cAMP/cGMP phosphodiesterase (DHH superfamily)